MIAERATGRALELLLAQETCRQPWVGGCVLRSTILLILMLSADADETSWICVLRANGCLAAVNLGSTAGRFELDSFSLEKA